MVPPLMNSGAYILTTKGSWCQDIYYVYIFIHTYKIYICIYTYMICGINGLPIFPCFVWCFFHVEVIGKETAGDVVFGRSI